MNNKYNFWRNTLKETLSKIGVKVVDNNLFDEKDLGRVLDYLCQDVYNQFAPDLEKRVAKKNFRTEEGLERSVVEGMNDALNNLSGVVDLDVIEKVGRDKIYRSAFYYMNEPLIYSVVRKFDNLSLSEEDRVSAAQKGFVTAMNLFDPTRGFQFSTFAYGLIMHEIIAVEKDRKKSTVIKYKPRQVLASNDMTVIRVEKAVGHRIIKINKEVQTLYNITIVKDGEESEYTYQYLYQINPKIKVGYHIKQGELLGTLDGAEVDLDSVEGHIEGERSGETLFVNPLDYRSEGYRRPDNEGARGEILKQLKESIASLNENEILIVQRRLLPVKNDKATLKMLSDELGLPTSDVKLLETRTLNKLRNELESRGIEAKDMGIFE